MDNLIINPIGHVLHEQGKFIISVDKQFIPALTSIDGFSHLQIIWWGSQVDSAEHRKITTVNKPYVKGPDTLGIFATRSPLRPNPLLITNITVAGVDISKGYIYTYYIDAEPGTPILDIKPYHLSERVKQCTVPDWCKHWPKWDEDAADFDWQKEFSF